MKKLFSIQRFYNSFKFALKGVAAALGQPNLQIHLIATITVTVAGFYFDISRGEWAAQTLAIIMVWGAEMLNTALEETIDLLHPQQNPKAGRIKDIAAGAVLIIAFGAAVVGAIIYAQRIINLF